MEWFEELPPSCPPLNAVDCKGIYYRVSHEKPAESHDIFSQRLLAPDKQVKREGIDECIVRAVSVFSELNDAKNLLKLPKFKKANIAELHLQEQDGKIKKTFKKSRYSWWKSKSFNVNNVEIIEL